jgi:CRP-like cAMP-binding protein
LGPVSHFYIALDAWDRIACDDDGPPSRESVSMELTVESALSPQGMIGHATYLLLVVSMMMRNMTYLRIIVILSAIVGITYSSVILHDPVGTFWESLLVTVNIVQLAITHYLNRRARFSEEEAAFMQGRLVDLSAGLRRRLLNCGAWTTGEPGTRLTKEGEPVSHLVYLAKGAAVIESGGQVVAVCDPGTFIGEMTVITGDPATGSAVLTEPSRLWRIEAEALRALLAAKPEISHSLEMAFSNSMREKLVRSNQFIVEAGGVRMPPTGSAVHN